MTNFISVSTNAARIQDISLNPQKLAGQCAKLKCCLNYEIDAYVECNKRMPSREIELETKDGTFYYFKSDILKGLITYSTDKNFAANIVTITGRRAFEVINMNRAGIKPDSLEESANEAKRPVDLLEQESVTRFDKSKKKKKKKKDTPANNSQQAQPVADNNKNANSKPEGDRQENNKPENGKNNAQKQPQPENGEKKQQPRDKRNNGQEKRQREGNNRPKNNDENKPNAPQEQSQQPNKGNGGNRPKGRNNKGNGNNRNQQEKNRNQEQGTKAPLLIEQKPVKNVPARTENKKGNEQQ